MLNQDIEHLAIKEQGFDKLDEQSLGNESNSNPLESYLGYKIVPNELKFIEISKRSTHQTEETSEPAKNN